MLNTIMLFLMVTVLNVTVDKVTNPLKRLITFSSVLQRFFLRHEFLEVPEVS